MTHKISIIVPIYNTEKYLRNCLNSIINQTYKNLEIILINDGSIDNSINICNNYKNKDNRIKIVDKTHSGVSDTRNIGIKKATGEYIGFVDSDDYIDKHMFEILLNNLENYNGDISMCNLEETCDLDAQTTNFCDNAIVYSKEKALKELLYDKNIGNYMTVKLFKKALFTDITFPINVLYDDIYVAYKLFSKSNKIIYNPTVLYHYFQRKDSIVNNITSTSIKDYLKAIFTRYYDIKKNYSTLNLYNVYSIFNVVIKMSVWAVKINNYELYNNEIYDYYIKAKNELPLVSEKELTSLFSSFEKESYYLLKSNNKNEFLNLINKRICNN